MWQLLIELEALLNDRDRYLNGVFSRQSRWNYRSLARFIGIEFWATAYLQNDNAESFWDGDYETDSVGVARCSESAREAGQGVVT